MKLFENPVFLLIASGGLIGLNFPLGKVASNVGISPFLWPLLISLGAVFAMAAFLGARGELQIPSYRVLRFSFLSGVISFVAVNSLVFGLIPYVGSGYAGLMFATSPVVTLAFAMAFRFKAPVKLGVLGIVVGFIGACLVAMSRHASMESSHVIWLFAAFFIPVTLAIGNIYRTIGWPEGASPDVLALWANLFASLCYLVILLVLYQDLRLDELALAPIAAALQLLAGALTFPVYFRLQKYGGPVLLSQLGYIAAAVGLAAATLFLGERYGWLTWVGAFIILIGIGFTIRAQMVSGSDVHRRPQS